ncbi:SDR family oxidoreductase [bacterium]|nr:SDR family oxidoreductase [bacterium]
MSAPDNSPNLYIEKVSLTTNEILPGEIPPEELLVTHYRDYHVVDTYARSLMSWLVRSTGDEEKARGIMRKVRDFGRSTSNVLAKALGKDPDALSKTLFGLKKRDYYFRFKKHQYTAEDIASRIQKLKQEAVARAQGKKMRVFLTGGTGFVGKEIMYQAAQIPDIEEVVVLIRPKTVRHRITGEVLSHQSVEERGAELLKELWLAGNSKYRFIDGDIEKPQMGIAPETLEEMSRTITHVIHCAASVAFDDPYPDSFSANVVGSCNALQFSLNLQSAKDSPFVAHVSVETSYIHGKQVRHLAREDEVVFPRNFYNNYYELTKAMASLETERFMLEHGLRVVQLCPAIVIGDARTGNNRGDQKVVNAPVNSWGRARKFLKESQGDWVRRSQAEVLFQMAKIFPGDPSAELNLIPVDWVARGIVNATLYPECIGERIHLATDNRITAERMMKVIRRELRVSVRLSEPNLNRKLHTPLMTTVLTGLKQKKVAHALGKLGSIFSGYSEWGQPVHQVGNDHDLLRLPLPRPNTEHAFCMLCRHNKHVQDFGSIKDPLELSRREKLWLEFIAEIESETGQPAALMHSKEFFRRFTEAFDRDSFTRKPAQVPV